MIQALASLVVLDDLMPLFDNAAHGVLLCPVLSILLRPAPSASSHIKVQENKQAMLGLGSADSNLLGLAAGKNV